jgi:guanine deaminase
VIRIIHAQIFHTPRNPFEETGALEVFPDGAVAFEGERILATGSFSDVRARYPRAEVLEHRDCILIPGMVDAHVHYPQVSVIGAMGLRLLEWLATRTLPEEAKLADVTYARTVARSFLRGLLRNGTTTALVFGCHFKEAQGVLFEEAHALGLRITSGLNVSDQNLTPELHTTPEEAYTNSRELIQKWHNHGRLRYAVTPRFSLSCSDAMLETCSSLIKENPDLLFTSHINENIDEIKFVAQLFPWSKDYLHTYERHGLLTRRSILAHNVHVSNDELTRLATARSSICHCPSSNMFIGSGLFPLERHLHHRVHVCLGSDVGGGTGFSLLKEGLMAYQGQMLLHADGYPFTPAHLLYLATRAGAEALDLAAEVGDLTPGKAADFVLLRPPKDSTLADVLAHSPSADASLGSLFTLAREESVAEVWLGGELLYRRAERG